jgi:hypothetical protein
MRASLVEEENENNGGNEELFFHSFHYFRSVHRIC